MAFIEVYKLKKDSVELYKNPECGESFLTVDDGIESLKKMREFYKDQQVAYKINDGICFDLSDDDFVLDLVEQALGLKESAKVNPPENIAMIQNFEVTEDNGIPKTLTNLDTGEVFDANTLQKISKEFDNLANEELEKVEVINDENINPQADCNAVEVFVGIDELLSSATKEELINELQKRECVNCFNVGRAQKTSFDSQAPKITGDIWSTVPLKVLIIQN